MKKPVLIILVILILDQWSKLWIKTNMLLGQEFHIANWFRIHFTENNGMAFGLELQGEFGKLALSLFRIIAVSGIGYYLWLTVKQKGHALFISALALIFAGAMGNIIDSTFYGLLFSESTPFEKSVFMPDGGGYASLLHGRVVDMLYFPLIQTYWPQWVPVWGGQPFEFFRPVFNVSDSSITSGVLLILFFQKKMFAAHITAPVSSESINESHQQPIASKPDESAASEEKPQNPSVN